MIKTGPETRFDLADNRRFRQETIIVVARIAWVLLAANIFILVILNLPGFYASLKAPCVDCFALRYETIKELGSLGISPNSFAAFEILFELAFLAVWWGIGALVFWKKPNDWLALVTSFGLLTFGLSFTNLFISAGQDRYRIINFIALWSFIPLLYLFPTARFIPRWTRWLCFGWLVWSFGWLVSSPSATGRIFWVTYICMLVFGVGCQVYRYRITSNTVQKWQTQWVVYGITVAAAVLLGFIGLDYILPGTELHRLFDFFVGRLVLLLIPLSIGMAVFHSQWLDIDLITRRTLVYTIMAILLGVIYVGLLLFYSRIIQTLTGSFNQAGIVISTLAVVALISPLLKYIEEFVDRQLHHQNFRYQQVIEEFSASSRDEVDPVRLQTKFIQIVDDNLQPDTVNIWLRKIEYKKH